MRRNTAVLFSICLMACMTVISGCQSSGAFASVGAAGVTPRARSSYTPAGNTLADELQWLAVQTACVGIYNQAETGNYTLGDPEDYYRPGDIREYLANLSGDRTAVDMFYGICFNYAQAAYNDIARYKSYYAAAGVKDWYIAAVFENPGQIVLFDPAPREQSTMIVNGVPVKVNSYQNVQAHGGATFHAWLWVIANDNTIYWIDPTWTDNGGYVVWGVVRDGREAELAPSGALCAVDLPNDAAMDPFNQGKAYMNAKNWDLAIAEFNKVIRQDKNNALAYGSRGHAYFEKGDMAKAFADFNQAIRLDPASPRPYQDRAWAYLSNDYDKAIADYTTAIRLDPGDPLSYGGRGLAYSYKEDYARAIADLTEAVLLDPYDLGGRDFYWMLASVYERTGDTGKVNAVYDQAITVFTDAIGRERENPAHYVKRAGHYSNKKDYDKAIADYTTAIRLDPNSAWHYSGRGSAYRDKKDYDRAIADYTTAIRLDPNSAWHYSGRGSAYRDKKDYDRAIADYTTAIRLDPNNAGRYSNRGRAYEDKKDNARAIADYETALKIDPDDYSGKSGLLRLSPERLRPATAEDYYSRGLNYYFRSDYDRAIADYTAAIRLDSKNAEYYSARGDAYRRKEGYDKAIADYTAALKIDPGNEEAQEGLESAELELEHAGLEREWAEFGW